MIRIYVSKKVDAGNVEMFEELSKELVAASRAEDGNIDYSINRSVQDPSQYAIFEVWASSEALEAHQQTEHYQRLVPLLGEYATTETFGVYSEI